MIAAFLMMEDLPESMKGNYSDNDPVKRTAGYVGQLAARKWLDNAINVDCIDYDLLVGDVRVEVKTALRNVNPNPDHWARIAASNDAQLCDYYLFCQAQFALYQNKKKLRRGAYILGMLSVNEMRERMHWAAKGSQENGDDFKERGDCWKVKHNRLIPPWMASKMISLKGA
jgi:hypothetical protein